MTNPAADGGAGCQQSKVSIIYHLLKDTALCSHAGVCVKCISISLPSVGAGGGSPSTSLCWSKVWGWDIPKPVTPGQAGMAGDCAGSPGITPSARTQSRAGKPEVRAGMHTQVASPHGPVDKTVVSPVSGESRRHLWHSWDGIQARSHVWDSSTSLLTLQWDGRLEKATGENWNFINRVCVCLCK